MKHPFFSLAFAATLGALLLSCDRPAESKSSEPPKVTDSNKSADPAKPAEPSPKPAEPKEAAAPQKEAATDAIPAIKEAVILKTSEGELVLEFWPEVAPKTVENFLKLARAGFYDGTAFHRIIDGFMIQGGDPLTKDPSQEARWGTGSADERIKAEFNERKHEFGVISMARSANPDSASSQFFICLGPTPQLDGKYTAFGKLIKGEEVLKKLGATPCGPGGDGNNSKPLSRVALESAKVVPADSIK